MESSARHIASTGLEEAALGNRRARARRRSEETTGRNLARVGEVEASRLTEVLIRLLDVVGAALLLVLLSPLLICVAVAIRLDSPGSVLFRQQRVGRNLKPFGVAKFRTMGEGTGVEVHREYVERMIGEADAAGRPMAKLAGDSRVTRVGAFLRRTSIDELPQLWNVLRGEMSLVGPRPPIGYEVAKYPNAAFRRFAVRPGLTGLWQVSGRSQLSFQRMIELDAEYVDSLSLWLNLSILLRTVPTVIGGRGAA
jgi:lipopolysaccharide/colanic/teichoic acid biosynthesis glycosyltransferase